MDLDPDQHAQGYEARLRRIITGLTDDMGTDTVNVVSPHGLRGREWWRRAETHIFGYAIPPQAFPGSLSCSARASPSSTAVRLCSRLVQRIADAARLRRGQRCKGVLVVEGRAGKPASVAEVAVRGGTKLVQVRGTLEQVLSALRIWRGAT